MKSLGDNRISPKLFIIAPLVSMAMPLVGTLFDRDSKCRLIPLLKFEDFAVEILVIAYFLIPLATGLYGIYFLSKNKSLRLEKPGRFYVTGALVLLNLLFPFVLYGWAFVCLLALPGIGCYDIKIEIW